MRAHSRRSESDLEAHTSDLSVLKKERKKTRSAFNVKLLSFIKKGKRKEAKKKVPFVLKRHLSLYRRRSLRQTAALLL